MKKFLTIILAGVSTLAIAQKRSNVSKSIADDGKTLSINITGAIDGKEINLKCTESGIVYSKDKGQHWASLTESFEEDPDASGMKDFSKQVKISSESNEMFLRYRFVKNDEEFIFEKTVNIADKSESQRKRIIEDFEKEIGLPGKGMEI
ncbi:hypothetical protein [Dyadobacter luticola]|uniref:Uncharacterized protein n=1 Tax=Dyadobacter luticola TaxID=1979387 RepID=A0A5R9KY01_9BACT|nr:hypothetical protein [Dyadobacter luticola]TLV00999.1 hypothetical protein FEN17_16175 [Dyadobacter luticola]